LVSDEIFVWFTEMFSVACTLMCAVGGFGNVMVIRTFLSMGLKDGVTLSFVFLAVSDFVYLLTMAAHAVALGMFVAEKKTDYKVFFSIEPFGVYIFATNLGIMFYLITVLITTFLAIVRCLCVAMPLKFKKSFTRRTSVATLVAFSLIAVASYLPILVYMKMAVEFDPRVNCTRYVLWISPKRDEVKQAVWVSRDVFVTFVTQIVVIVCVVILTRSLKAASRFRNGSLQNQRPNSTTQNQRPNSTEQNNQRHISTERKQRPNSTTQNPRNNLTSTRHAEASGQVGGQPGKLSSKDTSVIQQVVLISVVYIVCNTPKILIDVTAMFVPEFTLGKSYQNLYLAVICIMEIFQAFNSSISISIYYKYNTKFRKQF
ncbi:unnamed protein product, partial [Lymnaea stagnalis]